MAELGFVVAVAVLAVAVTNALAGGARPLDKRLTALATAALVLGAAMMAFGGGSSRDVRSRAIAALAAFVFGLGCALATATLHQRVSGSGSLRVAAASAVSPLAVAGAGAAVVIGLASAGLLETMMFGWAMGGVVGALLSGGSDAFSLVALVTAAGTVASAHFAARNIAVLRNVGPRVSSVLALSPLLTVLASVGVVVGALSVRSEPEDAPEAPLLRGFAVASTIAALSAIAASHWWARPGGRGAWLALAAVVASIGSTVVLLVGRYYDDPVHRAARSLARAQRGGPRTRLRTGLRFGAESAAIVLTVAALTALAAKRVGESLGLEHGGALGLAIAAATALTTRGYLDAVATSAAAGEARTLAHDLFVTALATALLVILYASVALPAVLVVIALTGAAVLERVATAHGGEGELRRRAAVLPVLAGGVLAASALFEAVLGS